MATIHPSELESRVGSEIGVSEWMTVDQARIDAFADVTEDWQYIHVDPEAAKSSMFGGTIAHGLLTLSLLSKFAFEVIPQIEGTRSAINYGFDKVRNLAPVPSGARIRGRFVLASATWKSPTRLLLAYDTSVEIEGSETPALGATWLCLFEFGGRNVA